MADQNLTTRVKVPIDNVGDINGFLKKNKVCPYSGTYMPSIGRLFENKNKVRRKLVFYTDFPTPLRGGLHRAQHVRGNGYEIRTR